MKLLGHVVRVESHFSTLETLLVLVQDSCSVCAEHTTGSEIVLDAHNGVAR
jgi:hypothetical protein